jgi:drug/metabolite transporter (DMT)-like permease
MRTLLLALASALLFGLSTPLSKHLLAQWTPQQLAGLLYLGAALGIFIPLDLSRQRFFIRMSRATLQKLLGSIFFGGILGPLFLMEGLRLASASSASLWLNLEMVATSLLGVAFFRDHLGRFGWLGAACVLGAGVALSWGEGSAGLKAGGFLALACVCWGLDNNLTALIDGIQPMQSTFWKGLVAGVFNLGLGISLHPWPTSPGTTLTLALLTGALSYGASIALYITAAQGLGAARSQMIFASAPLFGVLASMLWLKESITPYHLIAFALQTGGIVLLFKDRHSHAHTHEALNHTHSHRHDDQHHDHVHEGQPSGLMHTHLHSHEPVSHTHPHWPDLHHRHSH